MTDAYELTDEDLEMVVGQEPSLAPYETHDVDGDPYERITGRIHDDQLYGDVITPSGQMKPARALVGRPDERHDDELDDGLDDDPAFRQFIEIDEQRQVDGADNARETYEALTGRQADPEDLALDHPLEETRQGVSDAPNGKEASQNEIDAAITLLRKHQAPDSVLDSMKDEAILAWASKLKPIHAKNQDAHRQLAEARNGSEKSSKQDDTEAPEQGSPSGLDLDALDTALKDELSEEVGGQLATALRKLNDENAALREQVSGLSKSSKTEATTLLLESLAKSDYPQLSPGRDGWRATRAKVTARARELAEGASSSQRYSSQADLLRDAALLELGAPERDGNTRIGRERAIHRLRDQGQPRERRQRSRSRYGDREGGTVHDSAFDSFRRREAQLSRQANHID